MLLERKGGGGRGKGEGGDWRGLEVGITCVNGGVWYLVSTFCRG